MYVKIGLKHLFHFLSVDYSRKALIGKIDAARFLERKIEHVAEDGRVT